MPRHRSVVVAAVLAAAASRVFGLAAFPGAEGFGANAAGGRGGDVYHVTTLANDPNHTIPGSLYYGLYEKNVPAAGRTIVFDVGGTISLGTDTLDIKNISKVTIAGQTAPSPITIIGNTTQVTSSSGKTTSNIIMQYLDFRRGTGNGNTDALTIHGSGDTHDIMVDHVSGSWSTDEVISVAGATNHANNVTIQYSIMSEALQSGHQYGSLIRMNQDASVSYDHNLYSDNASRNPRPGSYLGTTLQFEFQNNVIYNWSDRAGYTGGDGKDIEPVYMNYQGNYLIAGPGTPVGSHSTTAFTKDLGDGHPLDLEVYQNGNKIDSNHNGVIDGTDTGWGMFAVSDGSALPATDQRATPWAYPAANSADSADVAYAKVIASVGAFPYARATTDARLINEVLTNTGVAAQSTPNAAEWAAISTGAGTPTATRGAGFDTDKDGMPNAWEAQHGFNPAVADNNVVTTDGYTRLEHYLQALTAIANWNLDGNGNWSDYLNWRGTRPGGPDSTANFPAGITAPRTILIDIPISLCEIHMDGSVGYTLGGTNPLTLGTFAGRALATASGGGSHQITAPVQLQSETDVQVASGTTLTMSNVLAATVGLNKLDAGDLRTGRLALPAVNVAGGRLQLLAGSGVSSVTALAISAGAQVDLADDTLTTSTSADALRAHLLAGRIASSIADPDGVFAVGYLTNGGMTTLRRTPRGDANLNGVIDPDDYALMDRTFAKSMPNAHWSDGDFNYDGVVDQNDYLQIDRSLGMSQGLSPDFLARRESQFGVGYVAALEASVPEPVLLSILMFVLVPLGRRRVE